MAIKIEFVLVGIISLILIFAYMFRIDTRHIQDNNITKQLEFYDTVFTKVDSRYVINTIHTNYGVLKDKTLDIYHLNFHDKHIQQLSANKATFVDDFIYLEGNITVYQTQSTRYFTQNAIYNQKYCVLTIPTKFILQKQNDIFRGTNLIYDIKNRYLKASNIHALLEF